MTLPVAFTPAARADVLETLAWYQLRRDEITNSFAAELNGLVARMGANPLQFPIVHPGVRRALLRQFPYSLFFRVLPDLVQVIGCLHNMRDPIIWRRRSK